MLHPGRLINQHTTPWASVLSRFSNEMLRDPHLVAREQPLQFQFEFIVSLCWQRHGDRLRDVEQMLDGSLWCPDQDAVPQVEDVPLRAGLLQNVPRRCFNGCIVSKKDDWVQVALQA